jgi:hypothetical protein
MVRKNLTLDEFISIIDDMEEFEILQQIRFYMPGIDDAISKNIDSSELQSLLAVKSTFEEILIENNCL